MRPDEIPVARAQDLILSRIEADLLVFDQRLDVLHTLNADAARLWTSCDGQTTIADVIVSTGLDPESVRYGLHLLTAANLMEGMDTPAEPLRSNRRTMLKAAGTSVLIPVVSSVSAPAAASVASGLCQGGEPDCEGASIEVDIVLCCWDDGGCCESVANNALVCVGPCFIP